MAQSDAAEADIHRLPAVAGTQTPTTPRGRDKTLAVDADTHEIVRSTAERLGRSTSTTIRAAFKLLNQATRRERYVPDGEWLEGLGQS